MMNMCSHSKKFWHFKRHFKICKRWNPRKLRQKLSKLSRNAKSLMRERGCYGGLSSARFRTRFSGAPRVTLRWVLRQQPDLKVEIKFPDNEENFKRKSGSFLIVIRSAGIGGTICRFSITYSIFMMRPWKEMTTTTTKMVCNVIVIITTGKTFH